MVHPTPSAKPPNMAKAKAKYPYKGKPSFSAPPPNRQNRDEAVPSCQNEGRQAVEAMASLQLRARGERGYGIRSVLPSTRTRIKIVILGTIILT